MTNILLVSTLDDPASAVSGAIEASDTVKVVVPVVKQGILDWLANDQRAFADAAEVAKRTGDALEAETVETVAGEADLELAIRDALATFPADEIIVVVPPADETGLIETLATPERPARSVDGIPVRMIVAPDSA
jgi:hypothetical protein